MRRITFQLISTFILCFLCLNLGIMHTWISSMFTTFDSQFTTLHRTMTMEELPLLGSLSAVGALVSTPLAGFFLDIIGRRRCSIIANLMAVIGWTMIACSNHVEVVLSAIFVAGLAGAVFIINLIYISEICHESLRGAMTASMMVFYGLGMLVQKSINGYLRLEYSTAVYLNLSLSVIGMLLNFTIQESPLYLLSKGLEKEAAIALSFFREATPDSKLVQDEMNKIRRQLNPVLDDDESLEESKQQTEKLSTGQFIKKSRSTRRAFIVILILTTASVFQGLPVVQAYAELFFAHTMPMIPAALADTILALVTVVSGLVGAVLVDVAGRKSLMIYGSIGSGVCCLLLGTQIDFSWGPHILLAIGIYLFRIVYSFGAGTVPYVLTSELFLPKVKCLFAMLVVEWTLICNYLILFVFNPVVLAIGLGRVFYIFAGVCWLTAAYTLFDLPETKRLTVDAIQRLFAPFTWTFRM